MASKSLAKIKIEVTGPRGAKLIVSTIGLVTLIAAIVGVEEFQAVGLVSQWQQ